MDEHDMYSKNYTLIFDPIVNSNGNVRCINRSKGKESNVGITIDDREFRCRVQQGFPSIIADIIDLAVAIHATDRLTIQNLRQEQTYICVCLPVRHPELLNTNSFQDKLSGYLNGLLEVDGYSIFVRGLTQGALLSVNPFYYHQILM